MIFGPYSGNRQYVNLRGRTSVKTWIGILILVFMVIGLGGCGESQPVEEQPGLAGPALIMFYTDN